MIVIDRKAPWKLELAWLAAFLAELGHERASIIITREYLHSMIPAISDEQETSMMVERQVETIREQAISIAWLLGADRDLDSSITIKSIVFHLFLFNLSLFLSLSLSLSLSHETRETRHERDSKQASNEQQEATRTNR